MIYVTGDTHGEQGRMRWLLRQLKMTREDVLIVCGDFGYVFDGTPEEAEFLDWMEGQTGTVCFIDGNHENFPMLRSFPEERWNGGRIHRLRKNVLHLMRGQVFEIGGKKIFTMGGAYSVDRFLREKNISYWDEELPAQAEYDEALRNLDACGWEVDYVLSHTAPSKIVQYLGIVEGFWPDLHDQGLTDFLYYDVWKKLRFRHWYFGHFHDDLDPLPAYEEFSLLFHKVRRLQ